MPRRSPFRVVPPSLLRVLDRRIRWVVLNQHLIYGPDDRVSIHPTAKICNATLNVSSGRISVGPYAFFSHSVSLLTGTHDYTKFGKERQETAPTSGRDIVVEAGVWIAANVTVIGPCVIGEHAVVAAGSVVLSDVPPLTLVAGVPAKVVRTIDR